MKVSDFDNFILILHAVSEIYGKKFSEGVQKIYFHAFADYSLAEVKKAFNTYVKNPDNGQFQPKPADIIKILSGTSSDASAIAWSKLDKTLRMVGVYPSVCFDDPIIHKVVRDKGGWISFGEKTEDEWPFVANDFKALYKAFKVKKDEDGGAGHLVGIAEADNSRQGFNFEPPILIGDKEKARTVLTMAPSEPFKITTGDKLQIDMGKDCGAFKKGMPED